MGQTRIRFTDFDLGDMLYASVREFRYGGGQREGYGRARAEQILQDREQASHRLASVGSQFAALPDYTANCFEQADSGQISIEALNRFSELINRGS